MTARILLLAATAVLSAQTPAFEVASIKPDELVPGRWRSTKVSCINGRLVSKDASVWYLIKWAWNIVGDNDRLIGAPGWAADTYYAVEAKSASPVSEAQCRVLLQNLLSSRFHLKAHEEKRQIDAFDLVVAKGGPKIRKVVDPEAPVNGPGFTIDGEKMLMLDEELQGWTMDQLADVLSIARLGKKVFNRTGLEGIYRIDLSFSRTGNDTGAAPDVTTALREQLGLQLRNAKEFIDAVVIDHIERPTPN